jgi:diguanylate cyclase (GGDEF)-like protein
VKFADPGKSTMPLFVHMLGMCLEEHSRRLAHLPVNSSMEGLPFIVAKLDREGRIQDASSAFLDTFGLPELPVGLPVADLLEEQIGLSKDRLNAETGALGTGTIISVPEGRFPGTPLYLSRSICESASNSSCLLVGDVLQLSPLQSLALAHPGILEALFAGISEQICLLSEEGVVLWADSTSQELKGRNIFSITKPESSFSDAWDPSFLAGLSHSAALHGLLTYNDTETHCSLYFSLLGSSTLRRYLMVIRGMVGDTALMDTANSLPNNQRDTLTGLYGYSQFHMLLRQQAALGKTQKSSLGILFCEIVSLREVNMRHGIHKGDMVLRQLAESIVASCRPGQDHPCRYGSDKFAVVVSKATGVLMESLAGNIRRQIEKRLNTLVRITIGLVLIHPNESPRAKLSQAKKAARQVASTEQDFCWADQSVS